MKRKPELNDLALKVWRIVRDAEGYNDARYVAGQLQGHYSSRLIGGALKRLYNAGHLRQRSHWNGARYGFTTACTPPEGESATPQPRNAPDHQSLAMPAAPTEPGDPVMPTTYDPATLPDAFAKLSLTDAQMAQQCDLARRMLAMSALGTPRVDCADPHTPQLLQMHALITAYQALAMATPGVTATASILALDAAFNLRDEADRLATTTH